MRSTLFPSQPVGTLARQTDLRGPETLPLGLAYYCWSKDDYSCTIAGLQMVILSRLVVAVVVVVAADVAVAAAVVGAVEFDVFLVVAL